MELFDINRENFYPKSLISYGDISKVLLYVPKEISFSFVFEDPWYVAGEQYDEDVAEEFGVCSLFRSIVLLLERRFYFEEAKEAFIRRVREAERAILRNRESNFIRALEKARKGVSESQEDPVFLLFPLRFESREMEEGREFLRFSKIKGLFGPNGLFQRIIQDEISRINGVDVGSFLRGVRLDSLPRRLQELPANVLLNFADKNGLKVPHKVEFSVSLEEILKAQPGFISYITRLLSQKDLRTSDLLHGSELTGKELIFREPRMVRLFEGWDRDSRESLEKHTGVSLDAYVYFGSEEFLRVLEHIDSVKDKITAQVSITIDLIDRFSNNPEYRVLGYRISLPVPPVPEDGAGRGIGPKALVFLSTLTEEEVLEPGIEVFLERKWSLPFVIASSHLSKPRANFFGDHFSAWIISDGPQRAEVSRPSASLPPPELSIGENYLVTSLNLFNNSEEPYSPWILPYVLFYLGIAPYEGTRAVSIHFPSSWSEEVIKKVDSLYRPVCVKGKKIKVTEVYGSFGEGLTNDRVLSLISANRTMWEIFVKSAEERPKKLFGEDFFKEEKSRALLERAKVNIQKIVDALSKSLIQASLDLDPHSFPWIRGVSISSGYRSGGTPFLYLKETFHEAHLKFSILNFGSRQEVSYPVSLEFSVRLQVEEQVS